MADGRPTSGGRYSRRHFLGTLGGGVAGAAVAAGTAGTLNPMAIAHADGPPPGNFGRMFDLPSFSTDGRVLDALRDLGKPGGLLDAKDNLAAGPVLLITDLSLSATNRNNPTHTAGTTFMGQFLDHDMTFDGSASASLLGVPKDPAATPNVRSPVLDLDSVYGRGPTADPQLYEQGNTGKFMVESGGLFEDLPRGPGNSAIIGDPRNDENMMIAGLHAAFLRFHNNAVDYVRTNHLAQAQDEVFAAARRLTTWHYHWIILHEFLPQIVGQALVDDVLTRGGRFFHPPVGQGFMPIEFSGSAYRFGHSMVRPSYRANLAGDNGGPFFAMVFDNAENGKADPDDLRGGARAPRRFIGWQTFFDFGDGQVKPNKRIDTKISTPLFNLTPGVIGGSQQTPTSLPQRNLLRQFTWQIPSGQSIASAMGVPSLSRQDLRELKDYFDFDRSTPLWYYVLKEAEVMADGLRLGPVGARIVGEVFIGLLKSDPASYLTVTPGWTPTLPSRTPGTFRMTDFLTFAGVDPTSRGQ